MLCEISVWGNFVTTWIALSVLGLVGIISMSAVIFYHFYVKITYEKWVMKTNPKYPDAEKVRDEIMQMIKGMGTATLCPALSLHLAQSGSVFSQAYCGMETYGWGYHIFSFFLIWIGSDWVEWYYHRLGHTVGWFWKQHKAHHVFYNPTPFAVIADDYVDQFARALPLLVFPMILPLNMDLLFGIYLIFFYGYGVYLHWGHELEYPDAHHPWINTAFQHYLHHAKSIFKKPYHTGFFLKLWDNICGSVYDGECFCVKCSKAKGERTMEEFKKVVKPDYSPLLSPGFWWEGLKQGVKSE